MKYNHSRFMRNWWAARLCHGCEYLHVGIGVDHNHCDSKFYPSHWKDCRVAGKYNDPKHPFHNDPCRARPKKRVPK